MKRSWGHLAVSFPDEISLDDLEILVKEWALTGGLVWQTTYWIGFIEHDLATSWSEFYIGKAHNEDNWVKVDTKDKKTALEIKKAAWVCWMNRNVKDPAWKAFLEYAEGELDYKLEEFIDDPEEAPITAEVVFRDGMSSFLEMLDEEVLEDVIAGLGDYGK